MSRRLASAQFVFNPSHEYLLLTVIALVLFVLAAANRLQPEGWTGAVGTGAPDGDAA